jgi:hypothetical protein
VVVGEFQALGKLRPPFDLEANPHKMGILIRADAERAVVLLDCQHEQVV